MSHHPPTPRGEMANGTTWSRRKLAHRPPTYLSCASLARELDVCERTVQKMVRRGVLPPPVKLSPGCVRWNWLAVQAALESLAAIGSSVEDPFMKGVRNVTSSR
jgi:predicted DNA-binding transcriptional regulator AlpA